MPMIDAHQLTKRFRRAVKAPGLAGAVRHLLRPQFRDVLAVDAVDLTIETGESVAYVGPNGAGKSTTIKLLTGILVPTAGTVQVAGLIPHRQRVDLARRIGVVFGQRTQLWWDLPVWEAFRLLGDIYEVPAAVFRRNLDEFVALLDLEPLLATPTRQLSLGQRMRCDLAAAFLHAPPLIVLDEPTIGLDVAAKERIRRFIRQRNQAGATVLLTSHDLGDIQDICTRLVMLDQGAIVFDGPLRAITDRFGRERVIHLLLHCERPTAAEEARAALADLPAVTVAHPEPHRLTVEFDATQLTAGVIAGRLLPVLPVDDLRIDEPSLESIIRRLYEGTLRFEEPAS